MIKQYNVVDADSIEVGFDVLDALQEVSDWTLNSGMYSAFDSWPVCDLTDDEIDQIYKWISSQTSYDDKLNTLIRISFKW